MVVSVVLIGAFVAPSRPTQLGPFSLAAACYGAYPTCPAPSVTSVSPNQGPVTGGTTVTITGTGFFNTTTSVMFGATAATSFVVNSDNQITAVSPAHVVGTVDVTVTTASGTSATSVNDQFRFLPTQPTLYNPRAPLRVLDTRMAFPLSPSEGNVWNLCLAGQVPSNATAVVLNVTVTNGSDFSWLIVSPTGGTTPVVSNLNWVAGQTVANLVEVNLGTGQCVTINNANGSVHVIADLEGWFAPPGATTAGGFVPLVPARVTDTRPGNSYPNSGLTLGAGTTRTVQITGAGGVPATGVAAIVVNATVTNTSEFSWLTAFATGSSQPVASNLNWSAGDTRANRIIVPVGTGGKVSFNNANGSTDLIIDVNGYFTDATASGSPNLGVAPSRILDTRNGTGGISNPVLGGTTIVVTVAGRGGVPTMGSATPPTAVVINVTATNTYATPMSWLTIWPSLNTMPTASDLNFVSGQTVPNLVVVKVASDGTIKINNANGQTDVLVDVAAWYG
ncbi:MAG TPA: IPT/TIG domain-containing protein [Candidatus Nitrosotalea sp.]|nr:IPT/TIG domain-containing protein [Candidatus Nitrosotalea sp.]